jgi:hypothetical protein
MLAQLAASTEAVAISTKRMGEPRLGYAQRPGTGLRSPASGRDGFADWRKPAASHDG